MWFPVRHWDMRPFDNPVICWTALLPPSRSMICGTSMLVPEFNHLNSRPSSRLNRRAFRFLDVRRLTLQQRIEEILRDQAGSLNATQLAALMGITKGRISQIRKDGAAGSMSFASARRLNAKYGYAMEWLMDGEPPKLAAEGSAKVPMAFIDLHKDVRAAAGKGAIEEVAEGEVDKIGFREDWLAAHGWKPAQLKGLSGRGASMRPLIQDGDLIVVNTAAKEIQNGKVYLFKHGGALRIKRLYRRHDGAIRIRSDNPDPEFAEETVTPNEINTIEVLGRVIWRGGLVQ